jgi:hypothetical protein
MKKSINTITLCLIAAFVTGGSGMGATKKGGDLGPPSEYVIVSPNAIIMPLGNILLIRKDSVYGAIRFIKFWTGKGENDRYATYESYYQGDKTGDFANKNAKFTKEELHFPEPSFSLFGHPFFGFDMRDHIRCGPIRLLWSGGGTVYFFEDLQREGDYGIELAPTKWTDISQVNVSDPRLKWYRYDEKRKDTKIPVDQLWEYKEK